jgi:thymidylate kinase
MKLIIFEGMDRCGKDSLIEELSTYLSNYTIRHWSFPQGKDNDEKTQWQINSFNDEFSHYIFLRTRFPQHIMFWNRSHLGELVYGTIYRDSNPHSWVPQLESNYGMTHDPDVYLIHLTADAEFIAGKDDGLSYSAKVENKQKEIEAFQNAVDNSKIINKLTIKVNDGDNYRDFHGISQEIRSFIGF